MADVRTPPSPPDPLADPAARGTLEVRTKAVQHVAERAALDVSGTVVQRARLGRIAGGGLPRASITLQGRAARVALDVAAAWPCDATALATRVRDTVLEQTARFTGVAVSSVDVTLHVVGPDDVEQDRGRVQ